MVKAVFHKNQRVFVTPVGTWASVERVIPQWVTGLDEPFRVHYDCGLGRPFDAAELTPERIVPEASECAHENWKVFRANNRWQSAEDSAHHPLPGTHPVVVTADDARGGWRVPAMEYDSSPHRYEAQARIIAASPRLMSVVKALVEIADEMDGELPFALLEQARAARNIMADIENDAASLGHDALQEIQADAAIAASAPAAVARAERTRTNSAAPNAFGRDDGAKNTIYTSPALRRQPATR